MDKWMTPVEDGDGSWLTSLQGAKFVLIFQELCFRRCVLFSFCVIHITEKEVTFMHCLHLLRSDPRWSHVTEV